MNCLVFSSIYPVVEKSSGTFVEEHSRAMSRHFNVTIFSPQNFFSSCPERLSLSGLDVFCPKIVFGRKLNHFFLPALQMFLERQIKSFLKNNPVDFCVVHLISVVDAIAVHVLKGLSVPVVVIAHNSGMHLLRFEFVKKKFSSAVALADLVVAPSNWQKENILGFVEKHSQQKLSNVRVIKNGVDGKKFFPVRKSVAKKRLGFPLDKKIVLFAGRLDTLKGLPELVDAWQNVFPIHSDALLFLAGPGWDFSPPHLPQLSVLGCFSHDKMPLLINSADVVVLPTKMETFSCITAESLACGKPVIAPMHTGLREIYNGNGISLKEISPREISEKVSLALSDIGYFESKAGMQLKKPLISWDESASLLKKEIEQMLPRN